MIQLRWQSCIIDGEAVACDDNGTRSLDGSLGLISTATRLANVRPAPSFEASGRFLETADPFAAT
jgi:hypothetical protein